MTDITLALHGKAVFDKRNDCGWPVKEVGKASMARTDKTPEQAKGNQSCDDVSDQLMCLVSFIGRDIGNGKSANQRPVKDADHGIPNADLAVLPLLAG